MINRTVKRILAALMACMILTGSVAALAEQVYVNKSVTVYASPKTTAKKLGTLKAGAQVELTAEQSGWAQIEKSGTKAYVKASALTKVENCGNVTAYAVSATALTAVGEVLSANAPPTVSAHTSISAVNSIAPV